VMHGGDIAASIDERGELHPLQGWMMALLSPVDNTFEISSERYGYVLFPAEPKSLLSSAFARLYGVVVRESGF